MKLMLNERGSALGKRGECLTVQPQHGPAVVVPVQDITDILIAGMGITVSADAVALACRQGIHLTFLSGTGEPYAQTLPPFPGQNAPLRRKQYEAAGRMPGFRLAQRFLKTKLSNQANLLKYFAKSRKGTDEMLAALLREKATLIHRQAELMSELEEGDADLMRGKLMGHEGAAGQAYWKALSVLLPESLGFNRRVHHEPPDAFNRALNYGYGILRARVWSSVVVGGLDPGAGFLHAWHENRDGLVLDIIEGFRQTAVDRPLVAAALRRWHPKTCDATGYLDDDSRKEVAKLVLEQLGNPVRCGRQEKTLLQWIDGEVEACSRLLQGQAAAGLPIPVW